MFDEREYRTWERPPEERQGPIASFIFGVLALIGSAIICAMFIGIGYLLLGPFVLVPVLLFGGLWVYGIWSEFRP